MCGIVGCWSINNPIPFENLEAMITTLDHRGPDRKGWWVEHESGIALGHTRLSILDLSSAGNQPMESANGRYMLIFNGEIYNHLDLRKQYFAEGNRCEWRGHSDTETILECLAVWGAEATLKRVIGMFAFALWDKDEKNLILARDRMGEKPLFYGWNSNILFFGSELKSFDANPIFQGEIDRSSLSSFLRFSYVPSPYSIYKNINKLLPGTYICIHTKDHNPSKRVALKPKAYWSVLEIAQLGQMQKFLGTEKDALIELQDLLAKAIQLQMISDVPLGAFLSGGIDSTLVVAIMQSLVTSPVKTFTIGYHGSNYNEAVFAKQIAHHIGTDHTELYVSPKDALEAIPLLPTIYDEPFADASQIPTYLVSRMTKKFVTVSLSGDAGDELFGGYNRHFWANRLWQRTRGIPLIIRQLLASTLTVLSADQWDIVYGQIMKIVPALNISLPGDKIHKLSNILYSKSKEDLYLKLVSHWRDPDKIVIGGTEHPTVIANLENWNAFDEFEHQMMYFDAVSYLTDDILQKVDRAAMSVSLETRVPFLDHRLVEFAWKLPLSLKIRNGQGKWLLRQLLSKYVPDNLTNRPKMGFGVPIDSWLRGPLREWAESLLCEKRLLDEGYFQPKLIRQKWKEHLSGRGNWQYYLWNILVFQAWLDAHKKIKS